MAQETGCGGGCSKPSEEFKGYTVSRDNEVSSLLWFHCSELQHHSTTSLMQEKEQHKTRPRLSLKDPCQLSSSHPNQSCRASGERSSWGIMQGGKIDSAKLQREMFCLPIQLSISAWCPEGPAENRATPATSPNYPNVPLYLLVAFVPAGGKAVEQDGSGAGVLHSCSTHVWAQGFEGWRRLASLWWPLLDMEKNS